MDRYWLLTWTTYGTWLPGDERGSVTRVKDGPGARIEHDLPGTPYDGPMPGLRGAAQAALKSPPIYIAVEQAPVLLSQFQETANFRHCLLIAVAIMKNHVHLLVGGPGDPDPASLLRDYKSYGSRALNRRWQKPASGTWWSESGSKRKRPTLDSVLHTIEYIRNQPFPLLIWISDRLPAEWAVAPMFWIYDR